MGLKFNNPVHGLYADFRKDGLHPRILFEFKSLLYTYEYFGALLLASFGLNLSRDSSSPC